MMWVGTHVLALLFLIGVAYGSGELLRRGARWSFDDGLRPLASLCLGLALWTLIAVALATLQWLSTGAVLGCLALIVAIALWQRWSRRREPTRPDLEHLGRHIGRQDLVFFALLTFLVLVPLAALALAPAISWDASTYHLTVPRLYLERGGFRPVELNVYSNWPLGTEMLYAMGLLLQDHVLPKLMHFAFGLGILFGVFVGLRDTGDKVSGGLGQAPEASDQILGGALAMALVLANGVVAFEIRIAYVDLAIGFYLLTAFLFLRRWRRDPQDLGPLVLAGVSCGLMAGGKLNGFVGIFALLWLLLPAAVQRWRQQGWGAVGRATLAFGGPIFLLWTPWLVKSVVYTGNPVYPVLYDVFGGPDWSPELAAQLSQWQRSIGMGRDPLDFLLLPWRIVVHGGPGYDRFAGQLGLVWLLVLPLALWRARRSAEVRQPLLAAATFFVCWAFTSQQLRLLIPALPLLAMAGARATIETLALWRPAAQWRVWRPLILAAALVMLLATHGWPLGAGPLGGGWKAAQRLLATPSTDIAASAEPAIFRQINRLPDDARLLFLNTNQGYFCRREYLADSFFEASQIAHWLAPAQGPTQVRDALRRRSISHVLLDRQPRPVTYPPALLAMLQDPALAQPVARAQNGRFLVFALQ